MDGNWPPRRIGMSKNDLPRKPLLSTFRNKERDLEPDSDGPPLEESQLPQVDGSFNGMGPERSDHLQDDDFPDILPTPGPMDEGEGKPGNSQPEPLLPARDEEEDPNFYSSFRATRESAFGAPPKSSDVTGDVRIKTGSPGPDNNSRQGKAVLDKGDDDDEAMPASDSDDGAAVPTFLTRPANQKPAKKIGVELKRMSQRTTAPIDDSSDDGSPPNRGNIKPSTFTRTGRKVGPAVTEDIASSQGSQSGKPKRSHKRGSGLDASYKGLKKNDTRNLTAATRTNSLKRKSSGEEDITSPGADREKEIFGNNFNSSVRSGYGKPKFAKQYGAKTREKELEKRERKGEPAPKRVKKAKKFNKSSEGSDSSEPEKPIKSYSLPEMIKSEDGDGRSSPARSRPKALPSRIPGSSSPAFRPKSPLKLAKLDDSDDGTPDGSQRPTTFKIPAELSDFEGASWLNSPTIKDALPNSDLLLRRTSSPTTDLDSPLQLPNETTCRLCKKTVDKDHFDKFTKSHPVWTLRNMQIFCQAHSKRSAKALWTEKGYPNIKWGWELDERISKQVPFIQRILEGSQSSHYGDLFRDKIKSGQNRTLLRSDELNLTPGYYGIRGLRQMSENLIHKFSGVLRKRALEDSLIAARGHTTYLQAVLVPELAVRLIMEDMKIGEVKARDVLEESVWVGEVLNDELKDVVLESDEEK